MLSALLETTAATEDSGGGMWSFIILGAFIVVIVVIFVLSSRRNKKRQKEAEDIMNSIKPGNKVKTIGGVCGIVVEVDDEENTFVLETGSEASGKCYMKFDKQAIYQTDAVVEGDDKSDKKGKEEQPAEEQPVVEEQPAEQSAEEQK